MKIYITRNSDRSWFTEEGARYKSKKLLDKFPKLGSCYFLTLTVDPSRFEDLEEAYEKGNRNIRELHYRLRNKYNITYRYMNKLEFHESGYPHWHIIIDLDDKCFVKSSNAKVQFLEYVTKTWGLCEQNGVDLKYVESSEAYNSVCYMLKYISKTIEDIPEWVFERNRLKIVSFSNHFFSKENEEEINSNECKEEIEDTTQQNWREFTIGDRIERDRKKVTIHDSLKMKESSLFITLDVEELGNYSSSVEFLSDNYNFIHGSRNCFTVEFDYLLFYEIVKQAKYLCAKSLRMMFHRFDSKYLYEELITPIS